MMIGMVVWGSKEEKPMDQKALVVRIPRRWIRTAIVVVSTALVVAPLTAIASHSFTDVPDGNVFHADIQWLKDAGVTLGCNPPTNTRFCPSDSVTREQMAAFMKRLADNRVVDAGKVDGKGAGELSVQGWARVQGNSVSLNPGQIASSTAACPEGTNVLGGGYVTVDGVPNVNVFRQWPVSDTEWRATGAHVSGGNGRTFSAYAICGVVNP